MLLLDGFLFGLENRGVDSVSTCRGSPIGIYTDLLNAVIDLSNKDLFEASKHVYKALNSFMIVYLNCKLATDIGLDIQIFLGTKIEADFVSRVEVNYYKNPS